MNKNEPILQPVCAASNRKEMIEDLRDQVADIKWDLQRVLETLDTLTNDYMVAVEFQNYREAGLLDQIKDLNAKLNT